jgi:hypothetical protein
MHYLDMDMDKSWKDMRNYELTEPRVPPNYIVWSEPPKAMRVRVVSPSANLVLENIGFVYPSMSMIVIGHSLLY